MAGGTIQNLSCSLPVADTLAMCAVDPVPGLVRMTLTADQVGIIEIKLFTFQGYQAARSIKMVTGHAPEFSFTMQAVFELKIVMRLF